MDGNDYQPQNIQRNKSKPQDSVTSGPARTNVMIAGVSGLYLILPDACVIRTMVAKPHDSLVVRRNG